MKLTFATIVIGGLIVFFAVVTVAVFVPSLLWNPPDTTVGHPYTPLQERGRQVFYSNGCNYCHTQYVREEDTGMGVVSQGGNYNYDNPMTLGSERTGPDLSYVGRKRSMQWETEHWKDPRKLSPLSIMPSFEFLSDDDLNAMAAYVFALGDRVAQERMVLPPEAYAGKTNPLPLPILAPASGDTPQGWSTWTAAGLQEGKETFVRNCLTCHGCAGNGLGSYGGTLIVTPVNFKQDPFRNMPDDQWFWHVSEGVQGTVMPPWKESLAEEQRWQAIRFVQQVFARPIERDPDEGDPSGEYMSLTNPVELSVFTVDEGKAIWTRECAVCHGDAGHGDGPYGAGLLPLPADFSDAGHYGTLGNPLFTDSDYFWRISEGLPWSAMQAWKLQYSVDDRWKLVHYIRVNFTQTEARPVQNALPIAYPQVYLDQVIPANASFDRGRQLYLTTCAQCHGLAGDGTGWNGLYLDVKPADLQKAQTQGLSDGDLFARVTFGTLNTSMPVYAEFLPEGQRWDTIKYIREGFGQAHPLPPSAYGSGETAATALTLSRENWLDEGHIISVTHGATLYATYCSTCHGDKGQGDGPGLANLPGGKLPPFPPNMAEAYLFWRIWDGVKDAIMPPFEWLLSEADIWDVTSYVETLPGQGTK